MQYLNDVLFGVIEGITEFLPISSTGHLLLAEHWLGARSDMYVVVIQAGAILAVTLIYWKRLVALATGLDDVENRDYLAKLVNDHGVEVRNFSDEIWDAFGTASAEVFEETRAHSALAAKIDDGFQDVLRNVGGTMAKFEITFVNQRNRVLGLA